MNIDFFPHYTKIPTENQESKTFKETFSTQYCINKFINIVFFGLLLCNNTLKSFLII